jgi:hypothetical protein
MLRILNVTVATLSLVTGLRASVFVSDGFENPQQLSFESYAGGGISSNRPFSGNFHFSAERNAFKATVPVSGQYTGKLLITCFIDPRGKETTLHFNVGSSSVSVTVDPKVIGYRQVIAELPYQITGASECMLTASGENGSFMLDDLQLSSLDAVLCQRPQPTQIVSNLNGYKEDMIAQVQVNGTPLHIGNVVTGDGYRFLNGNSITENGTFVLGITPEDSEAEYSYAVWIDKDMNGLFTSEELIDQDHSKGEVSLTVFTDDLSEGHYPLRIRMLDAGSNEVRDAYSGNTWGQTIDLLLDTRLRASVERCRCENPDYYMDMSGKRMERIENAPAGMYVKVNASCSEKIIVAN